MKINEVNRVSKELCIITGFTFTDNVNINNSDICDDLIHIGYSGTCKLANSLLML